jgi:GT2 family glycosyltransferase
MNDTLAIVLNWNELDLTRRCIASLEAQVGAGCDVAVVDNNSDQDPIPTLEAEFPGAVFFRNPENLGVAGGRNIGLRYALARGYEHVLLFDCDAVADPKMLVELLGASQRHPGAGIIGPKILRDDRHDVIWRAGCTSWKWSYLHTGPEILDRLWALLNIGPRTFLDTGRGHNQIDRGQFDREQDIDFQIGCAQLIRTAMLRETGLLDESFWPYGSEDIDLCARASRMGWRIRYVPTAMCWHREGGSYRDTYQRTYSNVRNLLLLARKNLGPYYYYLLFLPDYALLTVPLKLLDSISKRAPEKRKALFDAILWNLRHRV